MPQPSVIELERKLRAADLQLKVTRRELAIAQQQITDMRTTHHEHRKHLLSVISMLKVQANLRFGKLGNIPIKITWPSLATIHDLDAANYIKGDK